VDRHNLAILTGEWGQTVGAEENHIMRMRGAWGEGVGGEKDRRGVL